MEIPCTRHAFREDNPTELKWKLCDIPGGDQTDGLLLSYVQPSQNLGKFSDYLDGMGSRSW